jgi:hypothetical protein
LTEENKAAEKTGAPYLRSGKQIITELVNEISDQTAAYIVEAMTKGWIKEKYKLIESAAEISGRPAATYEQERINAVLWEIYYQETKDGALPCDAIKKALLDIYQQEQRFYKVLNDKATSALLRLNDNTLQWNFDGSAKGNVGTTDIRLDNAKSHILNPEKMDGGKRLKGDRYIRKTAKILFAFLLKDFTENRRDVALIPIEEYAKIRDKDISSYNAVHALTDQAREDIFALKDVYLCDYEKGKKCGFIAPCGGTGDVRNGFIIWRWNPDYLKIIQSMGLLLDIPAEFFRLDPDSAMADFLFYITLNYRMNEGTDRVNKINIETLLNETDKISSIDRVKEIGASVKSRVIKPFFEALNKLECIDYAVYTSDNEYIKPDDIWSMKPEVFRRGYLRINYYDWPTHGKRIEKKRQFEKAKQKAIIDTKAKKTASKRAK